MADNRQEFISEPISGVEELLQLAAVVAKRAYAPYSNFYVGAVLRTSEGRIFSGANVENASYSITSCAETSAIATLASAGYRDIVEVLVIGPGPNGAAPCGRCRQAIREFASLDTVVHIASSDGEPHIVRSVTLDELLPFSFGPENLCDIRQSEEQPSDEE